MANERLRAALLQHGLTPEASIRRDLMQNSVKHKPEDEALFGWKEEEKGLFTRLK